MKKNFAFLILLIFVLLSCSKKTTIKSTDRFVITSPELAEIIYLIGAQNNVVGVTYECNYPSFYKKITKVGNFENVNIEKVVALKPTAVFTTKLEQDKLNFTLSKLNIKVISIYPKSIDELINGVKKLGIVTNHQKRADFVADSLKAELDSLKSIFTEKSVQKPKVYVEIYNNPIMSASNESFLGQLIKYAGGENIFNKLPRDYSRVKTEDIISKNPDVIISLVPNQTAKQIANRKGWQNIKAVKTNRIYTTKDINPDMVLRAGSRVVEGISELHKVIYNEKNN